MAEHKGFRGRLFGGFNREDVAKYVEEVSAERNSYKKKCLEHEKCIEELQAALSLANEELEVLRRDVLAETSEKIAEAERKLHEVSTNVSQAAAQASEGFTKINSELISLSAVLDETKDKVSAIKELVSK